MTCGIYKLSFGHLEYIGKSDNILRRYNSHLYMLSLGKGTDKIIAAYTNYGNPILSILEECSISLLDEREVFWINSLNTYYKGLNSTLGGDGANKGEDNSNAIYSNTEIETCFDYILDNPTVSLKQVHIHLGISYTTVQNLAGGRYYTWLKQKRPEDYARMVSLKGSRSPLPYSTKVYSAVSPEGTLHTFTCIRTFALQHNIDPGNLGKVLRKQALSTKGWKLAKARVG